MAAAIGAGLPIHEPVGNMVVDVGGGTAEMAVISLGGVVAVQAMRCGGFDFDASIQAYVRHEYGVAIGERTAEAVKLAIGSASPYAGEQQAEIRGREVATGRPKTVVLSPRRSGARSRTMSGRSSRPRPTASGEAPPELAQDIMFQGVHLTGGGALLRGMTQRLADATAVPVHLVDTPLECVVQGAGVCLESFDRLKRLVHRRATQGPPAARTPAAPRRPGGPASPGPRRPAQCGFDPRVVEAGQRHRRPAPDRRLVPQRREHGGQPVEVADGAECGDRRLAAAGVVVPRSRSPPVRPRRAGRRSARNHAAPTTTNGSASPRRRSRRRGAPSASPGRARPGPPRRRGVEPPRPGGQRRHHVGGRELHPGGRARRGQPPARPDRDRRAPRRASA